MPLSSLYICAGSAAKRAWAASLQIRACTDHREGEGLVQPSPLFLLQERKASAWMLRSGQQATTNDPPLLGRAVCAHLQQRKPPSTFPSTFFLCFFFVVVALSFKQGTKQEGILRRPAASFPLHGVPELSPADVIFGLRPCKPFTFPPKDTAREESNGLFLPQQSFVWPMEETDLFGELPWNIPYG